MSGPTKDPADERLIRSVMDALWRSEPIRARDLDHIQAVARGGRVILRGVVATETHRHTALELARKVSGVSEVIDQLMTDEGLERRVAVALASDAGTHSFRIAVRVRAGVAILYGTAPSVDVAERIRAVALGVPDLAGVDSKIQVVPPGTPVVLAWQNSIEGRPLPSAPESVGSEEQETAAQTESEMPKATPKPAGMEGAA